MRPVSGLRQIVEFICVMLIAFLLGHLVALIFNPTLYGLTVVLGVSAVWSLTAMYWILYGFKQGLVMLIYDLVPYVPVSVLMWAIRNDNML